MQRQETYNKNHPTIKQMGLQLCTAVRNTELNLQLLPEQYHKYKAEPYLYIIQRMQDVRKNQWSNQIQKQYRECLIQITNFYNSVPYHNITHGFDVMTAVDKYLIDYKMKQQLNITDEERLHILIAAYAHDNGHQGLTNNFYINYEDELAIRYSNISPLQNMHSSNLLFCLRQHNINVTPKIKQLMVRLILATDNKHHFQLLEKIKLYQKHINAKIIDALSEIQEKSHHDHVEKLQETHRQTLLEMIIHTGDLSPCGKTIPEYIKWNQKLYDEFMFEYKTERQLNLKVYSFNFDNSNENQSFAIENLTFYNQLILPFFKEVSIIMPKFQKELYNSLAIKNYFLQKANQIQGNKKKNGVNKNIEN